MSKPRTIFRIKAIETPSDEPIEKKVKPLPEKPPKKKSVKRNLESLGEHVPMNTWSPIVYKYFKDNKNVEVIISSDADRVDVCSDGWRIVIMASYGAEFTVTLYYDYGNGFNTKKISVDYIKLPMLTDAIIWLMDSKELFSVKKEEFNA